MLLPVHCNVTAEVKFCQKPLAPRKPPRGYLVLCSAATWHLRLKRGA